ARDRTRTCDAGAAGLRADDRGEPRLAEAFGRLLPAALVVGATTPGLTPRDTAWLETSRAVRERQGHASYRRREAPLPASIAHNNRGELPLRVERLPDEGLVGTRQQSGGAGH